MPNEHQQSENDNYVTKCTHVEEAVNTLKAYTDRLRTLGRKKREARDTIERAKYHARNAIFLMGKLEEFME